jgi:hypothetical protein
MPNIAAITADARVLLQDKVVPYRYEAVELDGYARDAVATFLRLRPDLRIGIEWSRFGTAVEVPATLDDYWPLLSEYVAAKAELRDDQFTNDGRVIALLQKVRSGLVTTGL